MAEWKVDGFAPDEQVVLRESDDSTQVIAPASEQMLPPCGSVGAVAGAATFSPTKGFYSATGLTSGRRVIGQTTPEPDDGDGGNGDGDGDGSSGLPSGGLMGETLRKASDAEGDATWVRPIVIAEGDQPEPLIPGQVLLHRPQDGSTWTMSVSQPYGDGTNTWEPIGALTAPGTGMKWWGNWDWQKVYDQGDGVGYGGAAWCALRDNIPSDTTPPEHPDDWSLLADKGQKGDPG